MIPSIKTSLDNHSASIECLKYILAVKKNDHTDICVEVYNAREVYNEFLVNPGCEHCNEDL